MASSPEAALLMPREDSELQPGADKTPTDVHGEDVNELLQELRCVFQQGKARSRGEAALAVRILDCLDRSTAAVDAVVAHLDGAACSLEEAAVLLAALGASRTQAAQQALVSFFANDRDPVERRQLAILACLEADLPVSEVDPALAALADGCGPLAESAHLVLAAIGRRVREKDAKRFESIRMRVLAAVEAAESPEQLETALRAVGNLGSDEVLKAVRESLRHESPSVRVAAVVSLRRTPGAEAGQLLLETARSDPASSVRIATLDTLLRRHHARIGDPLTSVESLKRLLGKCARDDASDSVRGFAARLLERSF